MALIHALVAALARSAGKVLNTVFGWATVILFGRVTDSKQIAMSIACFGSLLWVLALIGFFFPQVTAFAITSFVPEKLQHFEREFKIAMTVAIFVIPFIVGLSKVLTGGNSAGNDEKDESVARKLFDGWPYTIGLSLTLLVMMIFAPIMKVKMFAKRWRAEHIPVMVPPDEYLKAVHEIEQVLRREKVDVQRRKADFLLRVPTKILTFFAAKQIKGMVADQLTLLRGKNFEVQLHPSDLIISGRKDEASQVRAIIAEKLLFSPALLTWNEEANQIEREMKRIWQSVHQRETDMERLFLDLASVEDRLRKTKLRYEEWEVLYRERLQLEQYMLRKIVNDNNIRRRRVA